MWRHSLRRRCVAVVGGEGVRLRVCPRVIEGADDGADDAGVFRITMAAVRGVGIARFAEDEAGDAVGVFAEAGDFLRVVRAIGSRGGGVKIRVATVRRLG